MQRKFIHHLSKRDMAHLLELSYSSLNCIDRESLNELLKSMDKLFTLETILYTIGNVNSVYKDNPSVEIVDVSCPKGFVEMYTENQFHKTDAAIREFLTTLKPVSWQKIKCQSHKNYPVSVRAPDFGMNDGWTHGVVEPSTMEAAIFFLGSASMDGDIRTSMILEFVIPFLSQAHYRIRKKRPETCFKLTPREREILLWIKEGKSSWEISIILNCGKRVVDFHVTNIKHKLGVMNRAQLVAEALGKNLIPF